MAGTDPEVDLEWDTISSVIGTRNMAWLPQGGVDGSKPVHCELPNFCPNCGRAIVVSTVDKHTGYSTFLVPCWHVAMWPDVWRLRVDTIGLTCKLCGEHQQYANNTSEMAKSGLCYSCRQTNMWRVRGI